MEECIETRAALTVTANKAKARSLVDTARGRNKYFDESVITDENASYIFEGYYSSALEMLHALVVLEGYRVNNHICLGYYLRDVLEKTNLFRIFDDCRFKRNSLVYYGKKLHLGAAKKTIQDCKDLIKELNGLLVRKL